MSRADMILSTPEQFSEPPEPWSICPEDSLGGGYPMWKLSIMQGPGLSLMAAFALDRLLHAKFELDATRPVFMTRFDEMLMNSLNGIVGSDR